MKQKIFLTARWEDLVMANYAVPPEILLPYLPKGVELDLFEWKPKTGWNKIAITTDHISVEMPADSIEEFIVEHYYGYTKVSEVETQEYRVNHPRWQINKVLSSDIHCDFSAMYGNDFAFLSNQLPDSVIFAEGSNVSVDWKRIKI